MKVVKVHGALKERLGEGTFQLNVDTPAQAIKALCVNFKGLEKWLIDSEQDGIGYKVLVGKEEVTRDSLETLTFPWREKDVFSITPVFTGAGRGLGRFVLGFALVMTGWGMAAGFFGSGAMAAKIGTFGGKAFLASNVVKGVGVYLALNGVAEMLTPLPSMPKDPSRNENFGFGGVVNTTGQGKPVPIAYGRLYVGSAPISVSLDVDQVSDMVNPSLSSSSPADNAIAVAVDSNIVLTFSEVVHVISGNIVIKKTSDDSTIETIDVTSGQVTGSGTTTITINPSSNLSSSTEYYVQIASTAFNDSAGNSYGGIHDTTSLSFTTEA